MWTRQLGLKQRMLSTSLKVLDMYVEGADWKQKLLIEVVTSEGTIVMPTRHGKIQIRKQSVHWNADESGWDKNQRRQHMINRQHNKIQWELLEMFHHGRGVSEPDHPARSICAWGKQAEYITAEHTLSNIFGRGMLSNSMNLTQKVLLLGLDMIKHTTPYTQQMSVQSILGKHDCIEHSAILQDECSRWKAYNHLIY